METRIREIMSSVFNVDIAEIDEKASPDTIEKWDSLAHMNLIVALEEEFEVEIIEDEIIEMMNFKLTCEIIKSKGV